MKLKDRINADFLTAYKAHDEERVSVLRMLKSSLKNAEIEKKSELDDSAVISVLKKEIKQRKDAVQTYSQAGKSEAAQKELDEIKILEDYLPEQLSEEEIRKIVADAIKDLGATEMKDMGRVIGKVMGEYGDQVDGGMISNIVKKQLQG